MRVNGQVRGVALRNHCDFILKEKGKDGLVKIEEKMASLGYPLRKEEIKTMDFYPLWLEPALLLAVKELFGFDDKKIEEMGAFDSKLSLMLKIFLKYFGSLKTMTEQAPNIWHKYYTIGDLKVTDLNEKERRVVLVLEDFYIHPIHCIHLKGYFSNVVKMVVGSAVSCEEARCPAKGDNYHEFVLRW